MSNLVESLGSSYFRDFFQGAMFMYEGRPCIVRGTDRAGVLCRYMDTDETVTIPNRFFMGFKTFEYPQLGYRRFSPDAVGYLQRRQSVHRGLREQALTTIWSPVTQRMVVEGATNPALYQSKAGLLAFAPQWDTPDAISGLLSGDLSAVLLNERLLIEPSLHSNNDWYTIYYNQAIVGSMDYRGRTTFKNPKYEKIISPQLKAA